MLDSPWPTNSWLASMCWPERTASAREIDMASVSAKTVTATAVGANALQTSGSKLGCDSGGKLEGSAPTVGTPAPYRALRNTETTLPARIATIM